MKTPRTLIRLAFILLLTTVLGGCGNKAPAGQVVALVDGEEVTRRDLAVEPAASQAMGDSDPATLLSGVIDRKLAAAEARRLKLDRTPDYVAQARRVEEVMLSRTLFTQWAEQLADPTPQAVAKYITQNPQRFADRTLFLTDRIQTSAASGDRRDLAPLQTSDAVAQYLTSRSQPFQRGQDVLDSASLAPALFNQLKALPAGYPLVIVEGDKLVILSVVEARKAPLPKAEQRAAAATALKQVAIKEKLASLRKTSQIAYQAGYGAAATSQ